MTGILLIDKPADWTSFDVVNYVRKIVAKAENKKPKNIKVGHAGTLDPFATGLLVLLVGKEYTSKAQKYSKLNKTYEITMKLGVKSSTGDPEGVLEAVETLPITREQILKEIEQFKGKIMQKPPAYSAIKINGQRAYKLARAGKSVEIEPRQVEIKELELIKLNFPEVKLVANVSSGTYIRVLVEDIASNLGTSAYTTQLRRTTVGEYGIDKAVSVLELNEEKIKANLIKI